MTKVKVKKRGKIKKFINKLIIYLTSNNNSKWVAQEVFMQLAS